MPFDIEGAKKFGYSDAEIADYLSSQSKFDANGARKAGYSDAEIISHLSSPQVQNKKEPTLADNFVQGAKDIAGGAVRGAGSIGATLLTPIDAAARALGVQNDWIGRTDRREAMDAGLKNLGSNPDSLLYQSAKLGTEIAGTLPVGGILAKVAAKLVPSAPALANALRTGGLSTGNSLAGASSVTKAADMATRIAGGAISGGASSTLLNPEDALTGAVIGGVLPVGVAISGDIGKRIGSALSNKAAEKNAVENIANKIGNKNIQQTVADINTYYPKGAENIPVSTAGVTKLPELAQMEQSSRLRTTPLWHDFDLNQAKAVSDNVMEATQEADELSQRFADRAQNWADNWAKASDKIKPRVFEKRMGALYGDLQQAKASPQAVNPAVSGVLQEIEDTVMKFGKGFTPEHLQQLRAEFNGKVKPMAKTAMQAAPRDNPAIKSIITELDDILNASTSGKWDKVRQGYADDTAKVHASKAAQIVRDAFIEPSTGTVRKAADAAGDIPKITEAGLIRALDAARKPDKTLALSEPAVQRLQATIDALRRQNIVQNVKRSASAGGGSDTAGNLISLGVGAVEPSGASNALIKALMQGGRRLAMGRVDDATAKLLQSPDQLAKALEQINKAKELNPFLQIPYQAIPVFGTASSAQ